MNDPLLRLLWMIRVILITFYAISAMTDSVGLVIGYLIVIVENSEVGVTFQLQGKVLIQLFNSISILGQVDEKPAIRRCALVRNADNSSKCQWL